DCGAGGGSAARWGRALLVHGVLWLAVMFALYPVLWVVSLALSPADAPDARVLPIPASPSLDNFASVLGRTADDGTWLFGIQLFNSLAITVTTAVAAIVIATPAAYAMSRFDFVGLRSSTRA